MRKAASLSRIGFDHIMPNEISMLRKRLQQEEEHLAWFISSQQPMNASGEDTSTTYKAGVEDRIAKLKQQIASLEAGQP